MQVSQFEIRRLIQRVMEALGAGFGVDRDAARYVTWLDVYGLPGIVAFDRDLAALESGLPVARLHSQSGSEAVIDLDGSSIACAGAVVDYALAKFRQFGRARIRIRGCTTPLFLIPALAETSPSASLRWLADEDEIGVSAGNGEATVFLPGDLSLSEALAAPRGDTLLAMPALAPPPNLVAANTPVQSVDRLAWILDRGVSVDPELWRRLDAVAARVQVPATEVSRERGAGGGDANT